MKTLLPDWRKLLLFSVLMLIAVGGQTQAWGFDKDPQTKPLLYDLLKPFPYIWFIWLLSILPLIGIVAPFRSLIQNIWFNVNWSWWIAIVIYYYTFSCSFFGLIDIFRSRNKY